MKTLRINSAKEYINSRLASDSQYSNFYTPKELQSYFEINYDDVEGVLPAQKYVASAPDDYGDVKLFRVCDDIFAPRENDGKVALLYITRCTETMYQNQSLSEILVKAHIEQDSCDEEFSELFSEHIVDDKQIDLFLLDNNTGHNYKATGYGLELNNSLGETLLDIASNSYCNELVNLLKNHGATRVSQEMESEVSSGNNHNNSVVRKLFVGDKRAREEDSEPQENNYSRATNNTTFASDSDDENSMDDGYSTDNGEEFVINSNNVTPILRGSKVQKKQPHEMTAKDFCTPLNESNIQKTPSAPEKQISEYDRSSSSAAARQLIFEDTTDNSDLQHNPYGSYIVGDLDFEDILGQLGSDVDSDDGFLF